MNTTITSVLTGLSTEQLAMPRAHQGLVAPDGDFARVDSALWIGAKPVNHTFRPWGTTSWRPPT